ncbi:MAG: AAA family ATPase [Pseudomonadota bacterium]
MVTFVNKNVSGDNSLGKTFVLDVAWWALTRNWASLPARPRPRTLFENHVPRINYILKNQAGLVTAQFDPKRQHWISEERSLLPCLVLYARVDGGFSVWDPARNDGKGSNVMGSNAFHFSNQTIWDGLSVGGNIISNGLLRDWLRWQSRESSVFDILTAVLAELSPPGELIRAGEKTVRLSLDDVRDIPTVQLSYGDVPLLHISAGMRRIIGLAYMIVWAWSEHMKASEILEQESSRNMMLLLDEAEAHLHPQWQRGIVPSLLKVVHHLREDMAVQIVAGTHAPLVLASIEPEFNSKTDRLFHFYLDKQKVEVEELPWAKSGDATGWLISDVFGLKQARSLEAEKAIEAATTLMRDESSESNTRNIIYQNLIKTLPPDDPFWPRWVMYEERQKT